VTHNGVGGATSTILGVSASAGDLAHTHLVAIYERDDELAATVAEFVLDAIEHGGTGVVVATLAHRRAIASALASRGVVIDDLVDAGRYRSLDARDTLGTLMRDGHPDPEAFAAALTDLFGPPSPSSAPVHVFGEMVALLWDEGNVAAALDLESLWNRAATRHRFALLCAYGHASLEDSRDLAASKGMCDRHSAVLPLFGPTPLGRIDMGAAERLFVVAPTAPQDVRSFVRDVLDTWGVRSLDGEAEIVASELATNAVRHARSPFVVTLTRGSGTVRIAVRDASFERPVRIVRDDCTSGGRGVRLVAALARDWGVVDEVDGKSVWAEVASA
jgi:anti-sigma regulatory factor (Ser/Thr protein kinase)